MALSAVNALLCKARSAGQEEVDQLCQNITELLPLPDRLSECCALLRHLFILLQESSVEPGVPKKLLQEMVKVLAQPETDKKQNRQCKLCSLILRELMDGEQVTNADVFSMNENLPNKTYLTYYHFQDSKQNCLEEVLPAAVRWLCLKDFDSQRKAFSFLVGVSSLHGSWKREHIGDTSEELCSWLMSASLYQAHNPYSINPFRKDHDSQVTEIDGTPCRNFFTILNIGQYYTHDQYLNIYTFSLLYKWLYHSSQVHLMDSEHSPIDQSAREISPAMAIAKSYKSKSVGVDGSPNMSPVSAKDGSPLTKSLVHGSEINSARKSSASSQDGSPRRNLIASERSDSPGRLSQGGGVAGGVRDRPISAGGEGNPRNRAVTEKGLKVSRVLQSLVSRSVDYCFRVMDQCERKAKVSSDMELQIACLTEVTVILDLVCTLDAGQIPRVHQEMRRLYTRLAHDFTHSATVLRALQFFLNHSAAVVHDPQEVFNHFFGRVLSQQFKDPGLAFDTVVFLSNNITTLCYTTNIFSHFFPNIFKILAWHPRTFITEFIDLLPAMMSPTTALEVFHTLLDLPCMTAALEVIDKAGRAEATGTTQGSVVEPSSSFEAFHTPRFKPLFNFICRGESGQGDTINRLFSLHKVLEDTRTSARVLYCSQLVPVMIRRWFNVIMEEANEDFAMQIVPAMLERSGLLFDIADCKADIVMILGEQLVQLVSRYPAIVVQYLTDITEFLHLTSNMQGRHTFYSNMIYCIGEHSTSQHIEGCTPEVIGQYFDVLEVVTYEICGNMLVEEEENASHPKVLCHLMSAMAKLSSRRQDLIPRAILCLNKVAKQHFTLTQDPLAQDALLSSAQEHINQLKVPNFAVTVLNPPADIYSGSWHRDSYSLPLIVRRLKQIMTANSW